MVSSKEIVDKFYQLNPTKPVLPGWHIAEAEDTLVASNDAIDSVDAADTIEAAEAVKMRRKNAKCQISE